METGCFEHAQHLQQSSTLPFPQVYSWPNLYFRPEAISGMNKRFSVEAVGNILVSCPNLGQVT
jgi:hypothetical protein